MRTAMQRRNPSTKPATIEMEVKNADEEQSKLIKAAPSDEDNGNGHVEVPVGDTYSNAKPRFFLSRNSNTMFTALAFIATIFLTSIMTAAITKSNLQGQEALTSASKYSTSTGLSYLGFGNKGTEFKLAQEQSFGFFNDIPDSSWKLMQQRVKESVKHLYPDNPMKEQWLAWRWYQDNWEPDFSCQHERRMGGNGMGDGPKWVCNPHRIVETAAERLKKGDEKCLIYSIGSNGDFQFEEGLHALLGTELCEVHVFDPKDFTSEVPEDISEMVHFHPWGIINQNDASSSNFKNLQEVIDTLGHEGRVIDVFKIDCDGCEWNTYEDWFKVDLDIRQLLVEVHNVPDNANEFFESMQDQGFVTFHKEPNTKYSGGICQEYAFVKLHPNFFV